MSSAIHLLCFNLNKRIINIITTLKRNNVSPTFIIHEDVVVVP